MTRTLILTRHAKSSWADPALSDHDRPLNKRGRRSAALIGDWLRNRGHVPDQAISSTSTRTRETWDRLGFDAPIRYTETLYHAAPHQILHALSQATQPCVLILGHNPGIGAFAARILHSAPAHDRFADYPTCATLVATFDVKTWGQVNWHSATAVDFAIPRELGA